MNTTDQPMPGYSNYPQTESQKKAELLAVGSTLHQADYLPDLIEELTESGADPECLEVAKLLNKTRNALFVIEINWDLRASHINPHPKNEVA